MPLQRWAVRCTGHLSDRSRECHAWAVRGAFVCVKHGGRAPQVRKAAEWRLWMTSVYRQYLRDLRKLLATLDEKEQARG